MKRFFRFALVCWILITALCGAVIVIAHATDAADPGLIPGMATCGDVPCYLGISPDQTRFQDAPVLLAQVDAVKLSLQVYNLPRFNTLLYIDFSRQVIDELDISLNRGSALRAGDVIQRYGTPCYVVSLGSTLAVKYPHLAVFFELENRGSFGLLKPSSRVIEIRLLGGAAKDCLSIDDKTIFRCHGFSAY